MYVHGVPFGHSVGYRRVKQQQLKIELEHLGLHSKCNLGVWFRAFSGTSSEGERPYSSRAASSFLWWTSFLAA